MKALGVDYVELEAPKCYQCLESADEDLYQCGTCGAMLCVKCYGNCEDCD